MKTLVSVFITTILSLAAAQGLAQSRGCDLPYDLAEEAGVRTLRTMPLTMQSKLTSLQKMQINETAKRYFPQTDEKEPSDHVTAIRNLKRVSEGGDLYYVVFRFRSKVYTMVQNYPGGNPFATIFQGPKVIAELHDGDIVCE